MLPCSVMNHASSAIRTWTVAIVVLLVAAAAVFASAQQTAGDAENPVVMRLGGDVVRLDELNARFEIAIRSLAANQGVPLTEDVRAQLAPFLPQFLEQYATERVLLQEAERRDVEAPQEEVDATVERLRTNIPEGEDFQGLLEEAGFGSEAQLRELVEESLRIDAVMADIREGVEVTDEQLRLAYQSERERFRTPEQVCARHILVETEEDAQAVLTELEEGADFAALAEERSTGPSGPEGGELGCLTPGQTVEPFDQAAFAAPVGEPVGPVETQFGWHVILVYERTEAGLTPFEEARDELRQQVAQERANSIVEALIDTSAVQTYPDRLPMPAAPEGAPAEDEGAPAEGEGVPAGAGAAPDAGQSADDAGGSDAESEEQPGGGSDNGPDDGSGDGSGDGSAEGSNDDSDDRDAGGDGSAD